MIHAKQFHTYIEITAKYFNLKICSAVEKKSVL